MRSEDCDLVPELLQSSGGINHEPFRTTDTQIRMEEHDVLSAGGHYTQDCPMMPLAFMT